MSWTVKSLYPFVNAAQNRGMSSLQEPHTLNVTVVRRRQLLQLLSEFVQEQAARGQPPKGLEQAFAAKLQISPSLLSQIKKSRPIGDKLARQIEVACRRTTGWLDEEGEVKEDPDPAEEAFLVMASLAWRRANARGKRALMHEIKRALDGIE